MMLLKMELKKIWKPEILCILAAAGLVYGFLFLEFPLRYFPNGPQCEAEYRLMQEWAEKYGTAMDAAEYRDAKKELAERLGVTDETADGSALISYAAEGDEYLQQWAGALYEYELRYKILADRLSEQMYRPAEQVRVKDIIQKEKRDGILPYEAMGNAAEYWRWVSVFILLSVMVLLAPGVTRDMLTGVCSLQYTSKCGRSVLKTQMAAAGLSAAAVVLVETVIFAVFYAGLGTWRFWNHPVNSFYHGAVYWFDVSFGQYLLFMLLLMVLFAGGAAGAAWALSCFSSNYISLMLKIIPVFLLLGFLCNQCICGLFDFNSLPYKIIGVKGVELYIGAAALVIGMGAGFLALKYKSLEGYGGSC